MLLWCSLDIFSVFFVVNCAFFHSPIPSFDRSISGSIGSVVSCRAWRTCIHFVRGYRGRWGRESVLTGPWVDPARLGGRGREGGQRAGLGSRSCFSRIGLRTGNEVCTWE